MAYKIGTKLINKNDGKLKYEVLDVTEQMHDLVIPGSYGIMDIASKTVKVKFRTYKCYDFDDNTVSLQNDWVLNAFCIPQPMNYNQFWEELNVV